MHATTCWGTYACACLPYRACMENIHTGVTNRPQRSIYGYTHFAMKFFFPFICFFIGWHTATAQELVVNGGAESDVAFPWVQLTVGDDWQQGNAGSTVPAHGGSLYVFFPLNTIAASSELYQDIDVSANAAAIDLGTASYTFSGWQRSFVSFPMDQTRIIVEYRDATANVLYNYDTNSGAFSAWTYTSDTHDAPVGTRTVRIRLISTRRSGGDNDGYYDDISFTYNAPSCTPPASVTLTPGADTHYCLGKTLSISAAVSPVNPDYYYTWYLNGAVIAAQSNVYAPITRTVTTAADAGTYKLRVEDGNGNTASCYTEDSVAITLDDAPVAGTIASDQEICLGDPVAPLTGSAGTGGTAVKYYKWQRASTATGPWLDVQSYSTSATGYTTGALSATHYYRRIDSSGACVSVPTNVVTIRVNNKAVLHPITSLLRDTLCAGETFQLNGHVNTTAQPSINGGYYYTWKKVHGAASTTEAAGNSMTSFPASPRAAALADSGTYYLIVQDGASATKCKDSVQIKIHINQAPTIKARIAADQQICLHASANPLTETSPAGGFTGGPLYYQWYRTTDTTGIPPLTKITAPSTSSSYDPGTPAASYYYVRKDSVAYCTAKASNVVQVRVNNTPILDSIHADVNDTLCTNFNDAFQLKGYIDSLTAGKASLNGGYRFTWKKNQETIGTQVVSTTATYINYPAMSRTVTEDDSGTYYLIVQDGSGATTCLDSISIKIIVSSGCTAISCNKPDTVSIKVAATSNDSLCAGTTLILQKDVITFPAAPPVFGYMYSWIRTNTLGTVVVQGPSATYQDLTVNMVTPGDSGRYQLLVQDGTATPVSLCAARSEPIPVRIFAAAEPARIGTDTTICTGNAVLPFTELVPNSGGTGLFSHQWQSSSDGTVFTDIPAATDASYQSPPITASSSFRRKDVSGNCGIVYSDTITVTTTNGVFPGTVATANTAICYNTVPPLPILSTAGASGGTGGSSSLAYQWQQSTDSLHWADIAGAISPDYTETNALSDTVYYRRRAVMGTASCDTAYTTSAAILVQGPFTAGSIGKDTAVCAGAIVSLKERTPATGNAVTYQWVVSVNKGLTWVNAAGPATLKSYTTYALSDSAWYKRVATSACGKDSSNPVIIDVGTTPVIDAGPDFFVQKNTTVTLQGTVTGSTNYIWLPSAGLSDPHVLTPDAFITHTINYILQATDITGNCTVQSIVTIVMEDPVSIPNVITPNGDGVNDTWVIERIAGYPDATFVIYNRWGSIVWKAGNQSFTWNGTNRNGEALPDGTYYYIINLNSNAYPDPYTGYVQLVR